MKRTSVRSLTVLATAVFGACGDSTGVETTLTDAEAAALAEAVIQAAVFATASGPSDAAPVSGPQRAPYASEANVSFLADCPLGGVVDVEGSVEVSGDDETGEGRIELSVTHEHEGCLVEAENGMVFTFDGSPSITLDLAIESDGQGELGWLGTLGGTVNWSTDERHGRCTIALDFSGSVSDVDDAIAGSVEGVVCRRAVAHSWSLVVATT